MPRSKLIAILEATFAVTVWGASFVATKVAVQEVSPVTVVWLRFTIGVVILGLATLLRRQFALPERGEVGYFALLGFLGITFHQWLQSTGLVTCPGYHHGLDRGDHADFHGHTRLAGTGGKVELAPGIGYYRGCSRGAVGAE